MYKSKAPAAIGSAGTEAASSFPVRILYVEANEDHTVGGSHRALYDLVTHLDRDCYDPHVLFYQDNQFVRKLREQGIPVHIFAAERATERAIRQHRGRILRKLDIPVAIARRRALLKRLGIDLLHLNNSPAIGSDDWLPAAKLLRIPAIAFAMTNASVSSPIHRRLLGHYDRVLACSEHMRNEVVAMGTPPARVERVYLGTDVAALRARLTRSRQAMRDELGVSERDVLVVMVGNVRPWKGQHVLIAALDMIHREGSSVPRVLLVGATAPEDAPYEASLLESIQRAGLEERVTLLGARDDVPDIFNAADVAVHASMHPEPFGLVIVEAMALGAVVVAAGEGGAAEIVAPGTGLTFDPHSPETLAAALRRLIASPQEREKLSEAGRERAMVFSTDAFVESVQRAYASVLSGSPPSKRFGPEG
jgi:glycosyltransferase involved in cell wall biosynthesis